MRGAVALILALLNCVGLSLCNEEGDHVKYTNSWAVHVGDLDQDAVTGIATKYGFTNRGQIGKLHGYYLFERKGERVEGRRKRSTEDHTELLMSEPMIGWVKQQRILDRSKRNVISDDGHASRDRRDMAVSVQDPYFKDQWYLQNIGQSSGPAGLDINVLPVWGRGFTGQGVVVSILDDGVDHTHPDLKKNYDSSASFDFNDFDADPRPRSTDPLNCHGTRCAGEVAAEADNGICGVGVSFNASIGGIRMLDGLATDVIESLSLGYRSDYIDIYTCCWGPKDDGKRFGKPGFLASKSLKIGARKGRGGKGNIFVWATGNGGLTDDDCNCDGYTTSIYTISIGAISDHGLSTYYTETCASTIAVTFSGASHREADENKIVTTDLNHQCTRTFKGTSSAAPLASGMLALVLEANPNLTWRDVQHIIVETSQKTSPFDEGWKLNGAGKQFNHKFGFGKLDTMRMVDAALNWKLVAKQRVCHDTRYNTSRNIPSSGSLIISANTSSCDGTTSEVRKLEHVQVVITLKHRRRGDLSIILISPSGTRSQLLKTRRNDKSTEGLTDWVFMTVHFWGEDPKGSWSLIITDNDRNTREHHLIKAKQGDMEDVQRVVIDDSEKRGNWDSRVINEYERHKQATPGNATLHDHILKNIEDTTGELVKGNKFVELAKRLKNRKKNTNVFKAENTHTEHARNASKIPRKPHVVNKEKNKSYQKNSKHWHKLGKHKKMFKKHHKVSHRKHQKHPLKRHKKIAYRVVKHNAKMRRKNISSKRKSRHNIANKTFKSKNLMNKNSKYSNSVGKTEQTKKTSKTEKSDTEPLLADGSLEIPPGSSSKAKLALQALATPLIQKIMGISKTANFLPLKARQSLVGEVDIKMKLYGSGANKPKRKRRKISKLDFARSKLQHEHNNRLNKVKNPNLYVKLLRSMNGINENSQELKERKEKHINQVTNIHDNITDSEQSLTGSHLNRSEYTGMVSNESVSSGKLDNEGVSLGSHLNGSEYTGMISNGKLGKESVQVGRHINGSEHTGSLLNGSGSTYGKGIVGSPQHSSGVQSIKDSDESPLIFYDADSKKYVALTKVGTTENASPFVIASEGSGNGNQHQHNPEVKSEDMESSGELMNDSNNCGGTGDEDNCIINNIDEYLSTNWEDEDEDQNKRNLDQQKKKTKEPADDFGEVGLTYNPESIEQATGSKLNGNGNIGRNDSIPSGSRMTVVDDFPGRKEGSEMAANGTLNTNDYSNIENQPGSKSPGSENISNSGFTGSKMYKPETKITENLHSNMNDKSKENKKLNEHHEIIDTHNNERHFNPLPINTKESHSTNATHKIDENEKMKNGNDNEDGLIEDKNNETLSKMTNYDDENGSETMGNKLDSKSEEKYLETNFEDDRPIFRNSLEEVSGKKKINEKGPKDDFGLVDENEIDSGHQNSFSRNRYAAKKQEHAYDISDPLDEKVMKIRFETEYGKLNKTVSDDDYLGNDGPRYESDSGLKGSGSKHVQDEELVNDRAFEETGNENSGSGSDFGISGSGQERFYDFGDQGDAMMAVNDDVVGSDDITNDVIQNGKQHHISRFNNNVVASSGDAPVHSGNGMVSDELNQPKIESITKPSSARKQQKLNRKPLKLGYRNTTNETYVNESKESNVKSPKSTNKAPLQNMVPVNVSLGNTHNNGSISDVVPPQQVVEGSLPNMVPVNVSRGNTHNNGSISDVVPPQQVVEGSLQNTVPVNVSLGNTHNNGSISDVVPPQQVVEGSLPNTVPVNVSRGNVHNNGSIPDVVPPQQAVEGSLPNMVYADDATINEPDPISKGNNEIGEKKLSDHENKEKVPSQEMTQYVPNSYVPETQGEESVPVEEYKVPDHVSMHADPQASNFEEMEDALHHNSNLRGFSKEMPAENHFLRRVKQDIKQRNIDDLEQLESEVKNEMKRTMKEFNDDSSKEFFRNILGPELQDDDDSDGTRLFRRDLVKSDSKDHVPTHERSKRIVRKNEQEHSGILESWNLIFYGT